MAEQIGMTKLSFESFVIPICSAMGFAYVLRESGCDGHLVRLLVRPLRAVRVLLIPGTIGVGFFVNIAVISQASTSVAVGTVLIPLLRSAGFRSEVIGSALVLGASIGGELLNPGAPELQSITRFLNREHAAAVDPRQMQPILAPLLAVQLGVATALFWLLAARTPRDGPAPEEAKSEQGVNPFKAVIPLVPLGVLMVTGPPLNLVHVPEGWLVNPNHPGRFGPRLIGASMMLGTALVVAVTPRLFTRAAKTFFDGAGYAFGNIIAIIAAANAFGTGVNRLRMADWVAGVTRTWPGMLWPLAAAGAMSFAVVCGSGIAATESLYRFFAQPGWSVDDNLAVGAIVSIAAAAGRTSSPAAAAVLLVASLVGVNPWSLVRRVGPPLIVATAATAGVAWLTR
jgi:DcuC family C4-dicarboxylate transporter